MMSPPLITSMLRRAALVLGALALSQVSLVAHDMWIEPSTFLPALGQIVGLRLRVGQDLLGDPVRRDPSLIDQFIFADSTGRQAVVGRDGGDPAGFIRVATPGLVIVGYRSKPSAIELAPEKFNDYLKEEGLDAVAALRAHRNQAGSKAREIFSRCAKSLVLAGQATDGHGDRPLGFTLELVAERNPYAIGFGQDLPFRLTYENRPLGGALVVAINRFNPSEKLTARTDNDGRVRFRFGRAGMWLVKVVHMVPAPARANAEWASYWASLTFSLKDHETARH
jgi:uncharacterized GH25 family protein